MEEVPVRDHTRMRQGDLFDPEGPNHVLEGTRKEELLDLVMRLLLEAATGAGSTAGGCDEQDHV